MPSARQQLRAMLQRGETIAAPGAYDPLSARVVQSLGFRAIYTGGLHDRRPHRHYRAAADVDRTG